MGHLKNQRPEIWDLYNGKKNQGEHFRVFPISNWTELDVWTYLKMENIPLPSLYFSHKENVINVTEFGMVTQIMCS